MAHYLPPTIMAFFQSRPDYPWLPDVAKEKKGTPPPLTGVSQWIERFKDPVPPSVKNPTPQEIKEKRLKKKTERTAERLNRQTAKWDPKKTENATTDAYKTLFVGRLSYAVTEEDLKQEFEYYGPIKKVALVKNKKTGRPRGYAFVEFERSNDLKEAYKDADGRKVNGRRILVDVERGRTVKNWKPRRLGGGLGSTRVGSKEQNTITSGRVGGPSDSGRSDRDRSDRDRDRDRRSSRDRDSRRSSRDRGDRGRSDRERDRGRRRSRSRSRERDRRRGSRDRESKSDSVKSEHQQPPMPSMMMPQITGGPGAIMGGPGLGLMPMNMGMGMNTPAGNGESGHSSRKRKSRSRSRSRSPKRRR